MSNRFKANNAIQLAAMLRASGIDATVQPPDRGLNLGCSDPGCCSQHPGVATDGTPMLSVRAPALSNSQLHKLAVQLGLV